MITRTVIVHEGPGGLFEAMQVHDSALSGPLPGVMIVPNVLGAKELDFQTAERIAALGYCAFVADIFGQGNRATPADTDPRRFMDALNADRPLLRDRLFASLARMKALDAVDAARTAATGYCFGGKAVLDLARAGGDVLAVVAFHGLFDPPGYDSAAITARVLVCHGWDDPMATPQDVLALASELSAAGADWQLHAYGNTVHAFSDRSMVNTGRPAVRYDEKADRSSWAAMKNLLKEVFGA